MHQHPWQYLSIRILMGWLVVACLPAIILFWPYVIDNNWQLTQLNSLVVSSIAIVLSVIGLDRLTQFPGQKSMITVLPVLLSVALLVGTILLIFRLPYSVYYLSLSAFIGVIFCFVSQIILRTVTKPIIGYIPLGRCHDLLTIEDVSWIRLSRDIISNQKQFIMLNAVVADLADSSLTDDWQRFLAEATLQGIPVYNVLQVRESLTGRLPIKHLYENNLGSLLPSQSYLLIKRIMDTLIIIITLPIVLVLALFVILGIKWDSRHTGGSVLFTQQRVGQGGKLFTMYKFRSMVPTSEKSGARMASTNDMRITKFGHFIRKTRLDELPQFINVLKGEMSLIGPRPEQPSFVKQFNETIPFYSYRHIVKPGISGWAQVMHGYASDEDETKVKLEHDFFYIKNFSLTLDLLIVIKTIQTMITGFGAR
ncbi:sugar transferase [Psychrobacter sp. I-STPA6b]|uniref:sugar transferase n=1 Tax=Psychrobacter sp. I-STPA6b TaxID=2585718 RepID=UPI001D0C657C|nr:sugar transferase [Psychrobacter sp. I-STPA6b]